MLDKLSRVEMAKRGFNIDEYRADAQRRQEWAEEMEIKREANEIAADNAKTARKAVVVSVFATAISLIALAVSFYYRS